MAVSLHTACTFRSTSLGRHPPPSPSLSSRFLPILTSVSLSSILTPPLFPRPPFLLLSVPAVSLSLYLAKARALTLRD